MTGDYRGKIDYTKEQSGRLQASMGEAATQFIGLKHNMLGFEMAGLEVKMSRTNSIHQAELANSKKFGLEGNLESLICLALDVMMSQIPPIS